MCPAAILPDAEGTTHAPGWGSVPPAAQDATIAQPVGGRYNTWFKDRNKTNIAASGWGKTKGKMKIV